MGKKRKNLIGQRFGRLLVIDRTENNKNGKSCFVCQCECGNVVTKDVGHLRPNGTRSCGCLSKESARELLMIRENSYRIVNDCVYIKLTNCEQETIIDLEDYVLITPWLCSLQKDHVYCSKNGINKAITHILLDIANIDENLVVDHIDRNPLNNRKSNLRICTRAENNRNTNLKSSNKSGVIGVQWFARTNKWKACIGFNKKHIHLGYFINKDDAIMARLKAEKQYFGAYAPQKELFEKYNI